MTTPDAIKSALFAAIDMVNARYYPVKRTKKNTKRGVQTVVSQRKRTLDFDTLTKLMLTMDGDRIGKELHAARLSVSPAPPKAPPCANVIKLSRAH